MKKTRKQDFLERHPNADIEFREPIHICCAALGYGKHCGMFLETGNNPNCVECWNKPVEKGEPRW
jgi:hypothetical protein